MALQKATRKKVKLRLSIASPTGFGKTVSALMIAYGITEDWSKIAVIDTENKSASLYADHTLPTGFHIGEFFVEEIEPPFTPEKYMTAIKNCEDAGIEVIVVDSVTHVWSGQGGLLEYNDSLGGNKFQNWSKTSPRYQAWLNSILHSKCHVITTNRKKQAYALINEGGKAKVEKQGMEDQIRDGYDYEMTIAFEIVNDAHLARASKDRTSLFINKPEFVITPEVGKMIRDWCEKGIDTTPPVNPVSQAIADMLLAQTMDSVRVLWAKHKQFQSNPEFAKAKDDMKKKFELAKDTKELAREAREAEANNPLNV